MRFPMCKKTAFLLLVLALVVPFFSCGSSGNSNGHVSYLTIPQSNHVIGLQIDAKSGKLSAAAGSPYTSGNSPSGIAVTPSKQFLYVANSNDNDISLFTVNAGNGSLTEVMPRAAAGTNPVALATDPAGKFLFVVNQGSDNISVFSIASGGTLSEVTGSPFRVGSGPTQVLVTQSGKFLYVANTNSSSLSAFSID